MRADGDRRAAEALRAGYSVRRPSLSDAERLAFVQVSVWREAYVGMVSQAYLDSLRVEGAVDFWRGLLGVDRPRRAERFVAVGLCGRIVGMAACGASRGESPVCAEELYDLEVLAEHRGRGVADLLIEAALAERSAEVWVLDANARAQAFYRRHGFVEEGAVVHVDQLDAGEVRMVRPVPYAGPRAGRELGAGGGGHTGAQYGHLCVGQE